MLLSFIAVVYLFTMLRTKPDQTKNVFVLVYNVCL